MKLVACLALSLAVLAGCATAPNKLPVKAAGGMLVDAKGLTLYTFDKDVANSGKSVCNGDCARKWPPLIAADGASPGGEYTLVTRDDGKKQWAFRGKPLYTWPEDQEPGDKYGDNYLKVWHIIPG
ncbi:hypothetical protein [Variovorax sp. dw_308]|uniref:COG4315 family predicted lipoprotein n=1 Tax=Variovorax sp. dw_308 TaxID=2721546 RepID=UPI001C49575A|nr:hypothetical protein [Variovorax sp. dw_308]